MKHFNLQTLTLLSSLLITINAIQLTCDFEVAHSCKYIGSSINKVEYVTNIVSPRDWHQNYFTITSLDGRLKEGEIRFIPRGFDKIFPNIKQIFFENGLLEIHQEDLKQFPFLRDLYASHNNIEVLEKGLFDFNPYLEVIFFNLNNIKYVDPHVFDRVPQVTFLGFALNHCHSGKYENNRQGVLNLIQEIYQKCNQKISENLNKVCEGKKSKICSRNSCGADDY